MDGRSIASRVLAVTLAAGWVLATTGPGWADGGARLAARLAAQRGADAGFPEGLRITSEESDGRVNAEVLGVLGYPFDAVARALTSPADWCDAASLHLNTKACVHGVRGSEAVVRVYSGRKHYEPPEDAFPLEYRFAADTSEADRVAVELTAPEGPMGTRDHRIEAEAIPAGTGTALRFACSYRPSVGSRMATAVYLATLGRNKVGFSVVPSTEGGEPLPVGGLRGIVERNAVRYYLALDALLATRELTAEDRFEAMLGAWFARTEEHPALHELSREEYLAAKRRERENRHALQQAFDAPPREGAR